MATVQRLNNQLTVVDPIKVSDKVVASPYLMRVPVRSDEKMRGKAKHANQTEPCLHSPNGCSSSVVGVSTSSGTLEGYIVLPVANQFVVLPAIPDDLALLADDIFVVLSIVSELQRRRSSPIS